MHCLQLHPNTLAVLALTLLAGFGFVAASPLPVEPVRKDVGEVLFYRDADPSGGIGGSGAHLSRNQNPAFDSVPVELVKRPVPNPTSRARAEEEESGPHGTWRLVKKLVGSPTCIDGCLEDEKRSPIPMPDPQPQLEEVQRLVKRPGSSPTCMAAGCVEDLKRFPEPEPEPELYQLARREVQNLVKRPGGSPTSKHSPEPVPDLMEVKVQSLMKRPVVGPTSFDGCEEGKRSPSPFEEVQRLVKRPQGSPLLLVRPGRNLVAGASTDHSDIIAVKAF